MAQGKSARTCRESAGGSEVSLGRQTLTLTDICNSVLMEADPAAKIAAAAAARNWRGPQQSESTFCSGGRLPDEPARPSTPVLVCPTEVPRRGVGSTKGRIALLHALAHIEFNAVDLAFDMAGRFAATISELRLDAAEFIQDWIDVGAEEAAHFTMLQTRLAELGGAYGDFPAHAGLWDAAADTSDDVLTRLAVAPMVLEARGLDVTPGLIEKLRTANDETSATILEKIYEDEIGHVAKGSKWFKRVCYARGKTPDKVFKLLINSQFKGRVKPPFNEPARSRAGLYPSFYLNLH